MDNRLIRVRLMLLIVLTMISGVVWFESVAGRSQTVDKHFLTVHFFDVGQGDAIFIETPEGIQVLIDGGPDSRVLRELGGVMEVRDRTIDMIVATHPDKDHVAGLADVLERYKIGVILMTERTGESSGGAADAAPALSETDTEVAEFIIARRGQEFQLGASTTLRVLFPDTDPSKMESNMSSIVLQLKYGDTEFMLTGDAPKSIEEYLVLLEGEQLESEVLKVGHHGSRTSTSELFLTEVNPEYAVVSAGVDNRYGHPHVEVTDLLFDQGITTLYTGGPKDIVFQSDGDTVWQK